MHNPRGYIDIHSHFLPGLDDGPDDYTACLKTARRYVDIGVNCVVVTPHCIRGTGWAASPEKIYEGIGKAIEKIDELGLPLRLLPGMEISLESLLNGPFSASEHLPLAETGYFLVEVPLQTVPGFLQGDAIHAFLDRHPEQRFILAHPERCAMFLDDIGLVKTLVEKGMLTQVNIGSILGLSGDRERKTALELFRQGLVHFLATDSHGRGKRVPPTPQQMEELCRILGPETVAAAFRDNPLDMLMGKTVPPVQAERTSGLERQYYPPPGRFMQGVKSLFRNR